MSLLSTHSCRVTQTSHAVIQTQTLIRITMSNTSDFKIPFQSMNVSSILLVHQTKTTAQNDDIQSRLICLPKSGDAICQE